MKTTRAKLMDDLISGKCDVGADSISASLERQEKAYFGVSAAVNGKSRKWHN